MKKEGLAHTCTSTSDADSHASSVTQVWVVRLSEEADNARALIRASEQDKAQVENCCATHAVVHIAHRKVQKLLDAAVVVRTSVRQADRKHTAVTAPVFLL